MPFFFDHYPYTNFHNVNLDWVLQAVKAWGQTVEANDRAFQDLKEANEDFKAYVTNYLQDLDITDEINTKLDAMLASGVLTPYFAPYVQGYVNSWLNSHVTPTSPALDNTLTLSGAAARADTTGSRLKDLAYINALSTPEVYAAINRSQVMPGYRVQGVAYDYDGHFYVCGGSVDEDGTGVIVKMSSLDFKDAEMTVIQQLGHANDITYYNGYLYVCTVGGGNAPQWGIYKINVNDFTDKTLISNAPENTIGITYRQGDFWLLAPYRIYRTTDFTSYEVIVDNTNNLMTAYGIPTSGRISQTIFRTAGYLIGWVCSFVFEERHYGAITFFSSTGQPVAFKMFPAYHSELQGAVYADMSIWLLSDGNLVNVFRMDPRNLSYIQLKAGDDLNDFTGRGTLYSTGSNVSSELLNSPSAGEGFTVQVERLGVYNTIQTARTNSGRELYRVKSFSAGTWGEWIEPAAEVAQIKKDLSAWKYSVSDQIDPGTMNIESGTSGNAYSSFWRYRKQARMVKIGTKPVTISFPDVSAESITTIRIYKYSEVDGTVSFVGYSSAYTLTDGKYTYTPQSGVNVIKVTLTPVESSYNDFGRVLFQSEDPLEIVYNHGIGNSDYEGNITFAYVVSGNTYTSGQMILPPNYRVSGNPVPLYVNVHGTGAMATWTAIFAETGTTAKQRNRNNYEYMANEGFAVLDLYPWTSKYYSTDRQVSPLNISIHQRAFIEGINYVCSRYNIDITNVGMSFKSLGGNLGHFFMHQTEIPIRAVAMLAPSTSYMSTVWNTFFLANSDGGAALRSLIVEILGLTGETNAQLFIDTDKGMNNATVMQFVEDHIDKFADLNIAGYGVSGATLSNLFEWSRTGVSTLPQWLQDKGFTTIASRWTTSPARGVPSVVNHPDLSKHSNIPVKFWQAPDDVNTSFHVNYTVYQWLLNSGTDADFRVLPENTGGHHALDTDDNALKSSGTTRLGIAYTDVATVYVEMADFFYNKMTL